MSNKPKIFSDLERIAPLVPAPLFWSDKNYIGLGCNDLVLKTIGVHSAQDLIGKAPHEYLPEDIVDIVKSNINRVIKEKKVIMFEEQIKNIRTGKIQYLLMARAPLFDDNGIDVIGTIVSATDITDRKELEAERIKGAKREAELQELTKFKKIIDQAASDTKSPITILFILAQQCSGFPREQVFEKLSQYASSIPVNVYWVDTNSKVVGANELTTKAMGGKDIKDYIGKTPYEFYPHDMADNIVRHNNEVIQTRKVLSNEEPIKDITTGETKHFIAFKAPLFDDRGNIIGLVGTSVDITIEKSAEQFKLETERQRTKILEQEKFALITSQASHDMRSPLGGLETFLKIHAPELPEALRTSMREAVIEIKDIANNLLAGYSTDEKKDADKKEERQPVLVSLELGQLISNKRYQHKGKQVTFECELGPNTTFVFIKAEPTAFNRMLSNLINNAVDAFDSKPGKVTLKLIADDIQVKIIVEDNGKGIPEHVLSKIRNNVAITDGKKDGHGLGMTQVREALKANNGEMNIESEVGKGTKINITFPIIKAPDWSAKELILSRGDTIVILDDDPSVHNAWQMKFKDYTGLITLKHFTIGEETIDFINALDIDKNKLVLLTDFELLKQEIDGLHVAERTQVPNSILVTSHFTNLIVRNRAIDTHTKMLPKQLVPDLPIKIVERTATVNVTTNQKEINVVIVEDSQLLADNLAALLNKMGKKVDVYYNGDKFLENYELYSKDTKICLDYSLGQITGVDIAEVLHEAGYTKLYLLTGWDKANLEKHNIPVYLTVLSKNNIDKILEVMCKG